MEQAAEDSKDTESAAVVVPNDCSATTIRLLLHAVDGLVPYLTPQLLRTCFPVEKTGNRLWMGLAVKDTCIVPAFATTTDAEKNQHPRGYQYTGNVTVDAWMQPYTRVTVPTFDMVADAQGRQHAKDAAVVATDQHVMLWTGNGRQPITAAQYFASSQGLQSTWTVPLFDAGGMAPLKNKRRIAAVRRTQEWSSDYQERSGVETESGGALFPLLVSPEIGPSGLEEQLQRLPEQIKTKLNSLQYTAQHDKE